MQNEHDRKSKPRNITLSDQYYKLAQLIGEGNASAGIREALKAYRRFSTTGTVTCSIQSALEPTQ